MRAVLLGVLLCGLLGSSAIASLLDVIIDEPIDVVRVYAQEGDPAAQLHLAVAYRNGDVVKKDPAEMVNWLRKAAAAGYPDAEYGLGIALATGAGVPRDDKEAGKWFRMAGLHGSFDAQLTIMLGYAHGMLGDQSIAKALKWDFLARRTLELRFQAKPGLPVRPAVLQPDGTAEFVNADGRRQLIDAAGQIRDVGANSPQTPSPFSGIIADGPLVTIQPEPSKLFRQQANIERQLDALAKTERQTRYFVGATNADYDTARTEAASFILEMEHPPQRQAKSNGPKPNPSAPATPPPPEALRPLRTDRSEAYPFGMWGREAIKVQPWKHAETAHFVVHYIDKGAANGAMRYIECAYFAVTETLQLETRISTRKMHVFIFPDVQTWESFKAKQGLPQHVAGMSYKDELFLVSMDEKDAYIKVLCHEATHAVVSHFYPGWRMPLWLNEGFAEYMGADAMALRRNQKPSRYFNPDAPGEIQVSEVFERVHYGAAGVPAVGAAGVPVDPNPPLFYAQSEKCVSALLEKLPVAEFPRFMNLAFAGNPVSVCLHAAYGSRCPTAEAFQNLVNAPQ